MYAKITVALAGNPNSGKTTIFNALTGSRQHVGNYPGVTVERKSGRCTHQGVELEIVDLPGTYSLSAYSEEELVARRFLTGGHPDVVVNIIDASNLERNLYLSVQLMELGLPLVLVFNMSDQARARGYEFDLKKLAAFFGAPIIPAIGHKGEGMQAILDAILARVREAAQEKPAKAQAPMVLTSKASIRGVEQPPAGIHYSREIEEEIARLEPLLKKDISLADEYGARWLAIKLLEQDSEIMEKLKGEPALIQAAAHGMEHIEQLTGDDAATAIASARYGFISGACQEAVRSTIEISHTVSDKIDMLLTNRVLGIPIFLGLMYLVFHLTFTLGEPPMGWIEGFFGWLGGLWPQGAESALKSLLVDGVIGGVGGVIVFLPNILLLFLAIAILEDTGYMARAAFIMDRLMHKIGLHGKSFIPMLIGFGCSVPAIMATRTLENRRDRLVTMLVVPLMSCGARLPIYALIIPAFFPQAWQAPMLWIIYMTGILLAVLCAKLLRVTILKGESVPFVMELPPYRIPTLRGVLIHMGERGWLYLKKAGTIILGISIILWALSSYPQLPEDRAAAFETRRTQLETLRLSDEDKQARAREIGNQESEAALAYSIAGRIGHFMEPALKPMGFDWKTGTALIGAFAAKEVFVAQLGIVYAVGAAEEEYGSLRDKLRKNYTPLAGFCIMLFCLISAPCMATIAVTRRESGSWKWALFQLGGLTLLAFIITTIVYQAGLLLGLGIA